MITYQCPGCFNTFEAEDEWAGKTIGCQVCGTAVTVSPRRPRKKPRPPTDAGKAKPAPEEEPSPQAQISKFLGIVLVWVLFTGFFFLVGYEVVGSQEKVAAVFYLLGLFCLVGGGIPILVLYFLTYAPAVQAQVEQCPACAKYSARQFAGTEALYEFTKNETQYVYDRHYDNLGREIGTTRRETVVPVTYVKKRHHFICKFCSHQWAVDTTERA